ncbi:hypothetical protein CBS101457_004565 [Exobasidium rhododendri]|nr:hypothetical protein CBS101457_004565 [Exobasidium rhododendri]
MSLQEEGPSPSQLAFDLHPLLKSIEGIAADIGLSNDSGVSFGRSTRAREEDGASTSRSSRSSNGPKAMSESSSSSSLKRLKPITDEANIENEVIESPTTTAAFDAREDVWNDVARRLKPFGDTLRHDRLRTTLGQTTLSDACIDLLKYSSRRGYECAALHEAQIELLRTLANLCIDHDDNRTVLLQKGGPQAIVVILQHILDSDERSFSLTIVTLLRIAAGALLNMQLDHCDTRSALRQDRVAVETLLRLATDERIYYLGQWYTAGGSSVQDGKKKVSTGASIAAWSWRIIQDLCANEGKEEGDSPSDLDSKKEEDEEGDKAIEGMVAIGADKLAHYLTLPMRPFIMQETHPTSKGLWDADDVSDLIESDMDIIQIATELLEACSLDSKQFRLSSLHSSTNSRDHQGGKGSTLSFLMRYLDQANPPRAWSSDREEDDTLPPKPSDEESARENQRNFGKAKAAVAKAIVIIAGEDENMTTLFDAKANNFMSTLKDWMSRDVKDRDDLVSTAMLAMGNLARKDSHCLALVHDHDLVQTLTALLTPSADIKVAHGIVCLLKNLSIPPDNKLLIGNKHQTIYQLSPYLTSKMDNVQPLQFVTVGLLKHLCAGCVDNAIDLISIGDTFQVLLDLIQRTEDVPTRMEGTRVLVNVIKTLWSANNLDADRLHIRQKLVSEAVTLALAEMIRSSPKYPVLVNEGLLALTLIASEQELNGAQLVASALLSDPAVGTQKLEVEGIEELTSTEADQQVSTNGKTDMPARPKDRTPSRKTTMDSLASQSSQTTLSPPRTSADMIATVLARRDARMPPQFASNACILIQTLVDGSSSQSSSESTNAKEFSIRRLLQSWTKALTRLSEIGPQETIAVAKKSLKSSNDYLVKG